MVAATVWRWWREGAATREWKNVVAAPLLRFIHGPVVQKVEDGGEAWCKEDVSVADL